MSFQDLEAGHVRGAPPGGGRRSGRAGGAGAGAGASQAVASGVFQINTAVATFQRLVNTLGTPKDTPDLRDRMCVRSPTRLPALPFAPQPVPIAVPLIPICFGIADSARSAFGPPGKLRFVPVVDRGCVGSCRKWLTHRLLLPMVAWGLTFLPPILLEIASVSHLS
jgi:hypothetical protein